MTQNAPFDRAVPITSSVPTAVYNSIGRIMIISDFDLKLCRGVLYRYIFYTPGIALHHLPKDEKLRAIPMSRIRLLRHTDRPSLLMFKGE